MKRNIRVRWIKLVLAAAIGLLLLIPQPVNNPRIDMSSPVLALGVDTAGKELNVSVQILLPTEGGGAAAAGEVVSGKGATLAQAFENLSIALGRKLEFNHCGIIVMGKDYAERGANPELSYLLTTGTLSPNTNLAVSGNENAEEFIKALNEYSRKLTLTNLLRYTASGAQSFSCTLIEYLRRTDSPAEAAAMPCIKMGYSAQNSDPKPEEVGKPDKESEEKEEESDGGDEGAKGDSGQEKPSGQGAAAKKAESSGEQAMVESASMTAVFKGGRLVNIWGADETHGLSLLDPRTRQGTIFIQTDEENDKKDGEENAEIESGDGGESDKPSIALRLDRKKVKIKTKVEDGRAVFTVKLNLGFTAENPNQVEFSGASLIDKTKEYVEDSIFSAYAALRHDNCDVIRIEDSFYRNHYRDFKRFKQDGFEFLKDCEFRVESEIEIK